MLLDGQSVGLAPKPFDTLAYLVRSSGRVVSKQELLDAVWPDTFITEDGLVQCVVEIRRALGDSAKTPRYIETVPKRGYRFLMPVEESLPAQPVSSSAEEKCDSHTSGKRGTVTLFAGAAAIALAAAILVWRPWAAHPASTGAAYRPEPGVVLMLPMQMVDGLDDLAWLRTGLVDIVGSEMTGATAARLIPRHRIEAAMAEAGVKDALAISRDESLRVARMLGAERLVTGSVQRVEGQFVMTASVIEVAADRLQHEVSVRGTRRSDVLDVLARFSRQIGDAIGVAPREAPALAGAALATRSENAYRAYVEALEREALGGRDEWRDAEASLTRAVREDPTFARAYVRLALLQQARRRWGYGVADPRPAVRAASRLAAQLPERERALVAGLASLLIDANPSRALESWTALLRVHPAFALEAGVPTLVADTLMQQGRWSQMILETEAHVDAPAMPRGERALLHSLLAKAFRKQGELERALTHARQALDLWPARDGAALLRVRTLVGRILVDTGRRPEAIELFGEVARDPHSDAVNVTDAAWGLYMAGQRDAAARALERALAVDPNYGNAYHLRGWLELTGGDPVRAADDFAIAHVRTPVGFGVPDHGVLRGDVAALYYQGVALARAGRADEAAAVWRRVMNVCRAAAEATPAADASTRWHASHCAAIAAARLGARAATPGRLEGDDATYYVMMARLYAVKGEPDAALEALRQARVLAVGDVRHIADDPNFERLVGDATFRRLVGLP